jgi:hypothetical protein
VVSRAPEPSATAELDALAGFGRILAIKLYRLKLDTPASVPVLPCLDHEAMLHEGIAPHAAAYLQDAETGDLHEVVLIPGDRRIDIDTVSTWGESSDPSRQRLEAFVRDTFPGQRLALKGPSWWRGERRVAEACRAQVSLRDVLLGGDIPRIKADIDRLALIGSLMEKQSRVASWGVRTLTGPLLAAAGVVLYAVLGGLEGPLTPAAITLLQYAIVGVLGAWFLYYGLKAVQLTEMANRVWKRTAEYGLILTERRRLADAARTTPRS